MRLADFFPDVSRSPGPRPLGATGWAILVLYLFSVLVGVVAHEPWFDEAQSWLIARDAGLGELLSQYLRYEGHPPLWYFLLMPAAKLGLPYGTANVISVLLSALGVYLFLRLPGIPLLIRVLLPFSFFIVYQYSVVARSYSLILPLLMWILHLYPHRREKVLQFSAVLILLSQVSLHGLALAWTLAGLYGLELFFLGRKLRGDETRRHAIAAGLVLITTAALIWILLPPSDLAISSKLDPAKYPARLLDAAPIISASMAGSGLVSVILWVGSLAWFWRRRTLMLYVATTAAIWLIVGIYANLWHEGLFFLVWAFVTLLTFQVSARVDGTWARSRIAALVLVGFVLLVHVYWGIRTLSLEIEGDYSASAKTARYLELNELHDDKVFAFGFASLALQPYFDENLYANYQTRGGFTFWDWAVGAPLFYGERKEGWLPRLHAWYDDQMTRSPEVIVVSLKFRHEGYFMQWLEGDGRYRNTKIFRGGLMWKGAQVESESFAVWELMDKADAEDKPAPPENPFLYPGAPLPANGSPAQIPSQGADPQ